MEETNIPSTLTMRTGAWYGDRLFEVKIPNNWEVTVLWPRTPAPLTPDQIAETLGRSVGQASIQNLCKGKSRPLIIVDDLNRPTPVEPVMRILLAYFQDAGIPLKEISILMATGSHGKPAEDAMHKKIGMKAAESCRTIVHDCFNGTVGIGKTSFDTPVYVNRTLLESDLIIGIGGIYPNYTAGFGGGTKLALGVLGIQSIFDLHFRHGYVGWGLPKTESSIRKDLNEIACMIGLQTTISLQINADREIVRVDCGDPHKYYPEALDFCHKTFGTLSSNDADIIISNTYPNDLSLTFAQMKGFEPLKNCKPNASRIAIASCDEGIGLHNIFPFINVPRFHKERHFFRLLRTFGLGGLSKKMIKGIYKKVLGTHGAKQGLQSPSLASYPVCLYRPSKHAVQLPSVMPGIVELSDWSRVLQIVEKEQGFANHLKATVYPCAFLQFIV